jgi:hypothetical protein
MKEDRRMGIEEIALLTLLYQVGMGAKVYLTAIGPGTANLYAKAAIAVGAQLAANVQAAAEAGLKAASAEFKTTQIAEKQVAADLAALPPIT